MAFSSKQELEVLTGHLKAAGFSYVNDIDKNSSAWISHCFDGDSSGMLGFVKGWMDDKLSSSVIEDIEASMRQSEIYTDQLELDSLDIDPLEKEQRFEAMYFSDHNSLNDKLDMYRNEY